MSKYNLICGDCLQKMQAIPDASIDLILCDLPYGTTQNKWDFTIELKPLWNEYLRIIKDNGAILLFCDGLFMARLMLSQKEVWRYNLIWQKESGSDFLNANRKPLKIHEEIAVFYKSSPIYNKQFFYKNPYCRTRGRQTTNYGNCAKVVTESKDGRRAPITILKFKRDRGSHPTQKPVALLEWLIKTYTNVGGVVLDNCMGSGSTGVACANTDRDFIGIELDENYFNIAKNRIEAAYNAPRLFTENG